MSPWPSSGLTAGNFSRGHLKKGGCGDGPGCGYGGGGCGGGCGGANKVISPLVRRPPVPYAKQMTQKSEVEVVDLFMVDPASNAGKAKNQR